MAKIRSTGKKIVTQCCACQKIRTDTGEWQDAKTFGMEVKKTIFSHSVCPNCLADLYPEFASAVELNL